MGTVVFYFFCFIREEFFSDQKKTGPKINFSLISILKKLHAGSRGRQTVLGQVFFSRQKKTAAAKNLASNVKKLKSAQW